MWLEVGQIVHVAVMFVLEALIADLAVHLLYRTAERVAEFEAHGMQPLLAYDDEELELDEADIIWEEQQERYYQQ